MEKERVVKKNIPQGVPPKSDYCEHEGSEFICEKCGKMCCEQCFGGNNCLECGE